MSAPSPSLDLSERVPSPGAEQGQLKPKGLLDVFVRLPVPRVDRFQITTDTPLSTRRSEDEEELVTHPLRKAVSLTTVQPVGQ